MKISQIWFIMNSWKVLCKCLFIYLWLGNLDFQTCHYPYIYCQKSSILSQDMHKVILVYFFILCMQSTMTKWHFACIMSCNIHKYLFKFLEYSFYEKNKCLMWISKIILVASICFYPLFDHFSFVLLQLQRFYKFNLINT